jgi:hypothetical protein
MKGLCMSTEELIDDALAALDSYNEAMGNASSAAQALSSAKEFLDAANQALHDDLVANQAYARVDTTVTPVSVVIYTAAEPNTYTATPIRTS